MVYLVSDISRFEVGLRSARVLEADAVAAVVAAALAAAASEEFGSEGLRSLPAVGPRQVQVVADPYSGQPF